MIVIKYTVLVLLFTYSIFPQTKPSDYFFALKNSNSASYLIKIVEQLYIFNSIKELNRNNNLYRIDSLITITTFQSKARYTYNYNQDGLIISFIISFFNNNGWKELYKITNSYNSFGTIDTILTEIKADNKWHLSYRDIYKYSSKGIKEAYLSQVWNSGQWVPFARETYIYDLTGNIQNIFGEIWRDNSWCNNFIFIYEYGPSKNWLFLLIKIWEENNWKKQYLTISEFDSERNLIINETRKWNDNRWNNYVFVSFEYDFNGNRISGYAEHWDGSKWIEDARVTYKYNNDNYFIHGYSEIFENGEWVPVDFPIFIDNPDGQLVGDYGSEILVYYSTITSIVEKNKLTIEEYKLSKNYPNPFNPTTKISYSLKENGFVTLKIYDVLGKEVTTLVNEFKTTGRYEVNFDASNLASGVYIYSIKVNDPGVGTGFTASKKMILTK